ncbi:PP2C family protein-serine/threonine phosphatase [Butyrivibrio proteoclasticus]|uniref:PP2C family protein-serine/threonine phosphatase n=1 Tax=Butyrivibrio proteoclasticus TaxID=43305 RepID=UPI00047E1030|nr:protein phosphatase 2C domain-containing protein [Butyrivibrio proteoclasticus]
MKYKLCISTDKGIVKKVNQDAAMVKVANTERYGRIAMAVLCDGMGGLSCGEVASASAVGRFEKWFTSELPVILSKKNVTEKLDEVKISGSGVEVIEDIKREWAILASEINAHLIKYGTDNGIVLGTTTVAFICIDRDYLIMNVGDSRLYSFDKKGDKLLTHDQSVVQDMIDKGMMTQKEAEKSPQKSVLLQCIGASESVTPQFVDGKIKDLSSVLLCSDGFWRKLSMSEIKAVAMPKACTSETKMKEGLDGLVEKLKLRGEADNISAVLINIDPNE